VTSLADLDDLREFRHNAAGGPSQGMYVNPKEAPMNSARRVLVVLVAVLALCLTSVAQAGVDYSMNSAGGDYAPPVSPQVDTASSTDSDFSWGAAALGAGAALALVLVVGTTRSRMGTLRSRREPA
jgi:hypothetical protein